MLVSTFSCYTYDGEASRSILSKSKLDWEHPTAARQPSARCWRNLRRDAGKRLAGVVLLGDGAQRAMPARDVPPQVPARRLADLGYPLYTVPLGQSRGLGQARDVAIEDLQVPEQIFVKNQLNVSGTARVEGFVNQNLLVQLLFETSGHEMETVAGIKVQSKQDLERIPIELSYRPDTPGEYKVTLAPPNCPARW